MKGGAWGAAIAPDGSFWAGSFGGAAMSQYSAAGVPLSPSTGWTNGGLNHPQGVAVDQKGNVWIANNYGPESAPGQGNVVAYPGGDPSKAFTKSAAFQHFTSIQVDQSGNIWLSNNWSELNPPTGGVGIAEIVGAATPVCTPLTPVPVRPSSSTATACARQTATPLAAGTPASSAPPTVAAASASQPGGTPAWEWAAITAAFAVLAAGAVLFFRRRYARS